MYVQGEVHRTRYRNDCPFDSPHRISYSKSLFYHSEFTMRPVAGSEDPYGSDHCAQRDS